MSFTEWNQSAAAEEDTRTATYTTLAKKGCYHTGAAYYEKDAGQGYLFRQLEFTLSEESIRDDR